MSLLRLSRVPAQLLTPSIRWSARGCVYYSSETSHSDNDDMKLEGLWHNELGSCMMIESAKDGMLTGWYNTKVGEAKRRYVLTGRYDHLKCRRTLGWTVTWVNEYYSKSESTTSWSGQYQVDPLDDEPHILTNWLLTDQTKPEDDWNSTHIGHDVFTRLCPEEAAILKRKLQVKSSHPPEAEID